MKKLLLFTFFVVIYTTASFAQKVTTIMDIQQVSADSLKKMDTITNQTANYWLDDSKYYIGGTTNKGDTVTITGVVMVKPRLLTYTLTRFNIYIQDTAGKVWAGINVLTGDTSAQAQSTLITALDTGMVVTLTGRVQEYGNSTFNSLTELFVYDLSYYQTINQVNILSAGGKRPEPVEVKVSDFANGALPPVGKVKFSTGEQYEGMYVIIRNVTVTSIDWNFGTFTFVDDQGNEMRTYDASGYYTIRGFKLNSSYQPPAVGTRLSYIRGLILTSTNNTYAIAPLYPKAGTYPGDIGVDKYAPLMSNVRRTPLLVTPNDNVTVTATIKDGNPGGTIDSTFFCYKVGTSPLQIVKLTNPADSSYIIPKQPEGTPVQYFFISYNHINLKGIFPDTSKSWGFYVSKSTGLTIYDLQYTPFIDGNSPYSGATVTVNGTVTADTSDIPGSTMVFMQSGTGPWTGINLYGSGASAPKYRAVKRGDSISVTGVVSEYNGKTQFTVSAITKIDSNKALPAPYVVSISGSNSFSYQLSIPPVNGTQLFEKWEGVLVKFQNVYVTMVVTDVPIHYGEWFVASSLTNQYGVRVNDNGAYPYYFDTLTSYINSVTWKKLTKNNLLPQGTFISSLVGIIDYTNSNYKLEPRKADDFTGIRTGIETLSTLPEEYSLSQNYPNPFNPTTTIQYSLQKAGNVSIRLFNTLGQEVMKVVDQYHNAGKYQININASKLASGIYFYTLKTADFVKTMKLVLMK
jgi:DNA/RNA endonuclease YhcR with UshA esterase domain